MKKITGYQERKKAGLCVRPGCEIKPEKTADGTRRSYCPKHNAANKKNSEAYLERQQAKAKAAKKGAKARKPFGMTFPKTPQVPVRKTA